MSIQVLGYWAAICTLAWDPTNIRDGPNLSHVLEGTAHLLAPHKSHLQSKSFSEAERERSEVNLEIEWISGNLTQVWTFPASSKAFSEAIFSGLPRMTSSSHFQRGKQIQRVLANPGQQTFWATPCAPVPRQPSLTRTQNPQIVLFIPIG